MYVLKYLLTLLFYMLIIAAFVFLVSAGMVVVGYPVHLAIAVGFFAALFVVQSVFLAWVWTRNGLYQDGRKNHDR